MEACKSKPWTTAGFSETASRSLPRSTSVEQLERRSGHSSFSQITYLDKRSAYRIGIRKHHLQSASAAVTGIATATGIGSRYAIGAAYNGLLVKPSPALSLKRRKCRLRHIDTWIQR